MEIQNIDGLRRYFETLQAHAEHLYRVACDRDEREAAALIREQWFRLQQGPVRALVLGVSSAGKSTLINALAGQIVVPEGKQTTSPLPVWVKGSELPLGKPRIRMLKKDDIQPMNCGRLDYLTDYCYTATEAGRGTGQEKYRDLKASTVEVDAEALKNAGITLIDTPGIGVSRGDNARVKEVLAEGCEMLIILFMDLHQQEVKDYFADLLVEEDAPLQALLDRGRVFLVLNATDEKHSDAYAVMDTREHLRQAFNGWDGEDRLFVFNALYARIAACGTYSYEDLLPNGFSELEREDAAKAEKNEKNIAALAQPQEGLDALCDALGMAVWDLCANPKDVDQLLQPIHEGLEAAARLLEQPYLDRINGIQAADYPAPEALAEKRETFQALLRGAQIQMEEGARLLSGGPEAVEDQWNAAALAERYLAQERFSNYRLMGATRDEADETMVHLIQQDDGLALWKTLLGDKLSDLRRELTDTLLDRKQNPELRFWGESLEKMKDEADPRIVPGEKAEAFGKQADFAQEQAQAAGVRALAGVMTLTQTELEKLELYFREKQEKVRSGGLAQGWRLFWLYPDAALVILSPLLERAVRKGTEVFLTAYRSKLQSFMPMLKQQYIAMLTQGCVNAGAALEAVRQEILLEAEAARTAALAQVHRELAELGLRPHSDPGKV